MRTCAIAVAFLGCFVGCEPVKDQSPDAPTGGDDDAGSDAAIDAQNTPTRCDPTSAFSAPHIVAGLNTSADEDGLHLDSTGLVGILSRKTSVAGQPAVDQAFVTARASRMAAFETPVQMGGPINTGGNNARGQMTDDQLTIYFETSRNSNQFDVLVATRNSITVAFGTPMSMLNIDTAATEGQPYLTRDETALWFFRNNQVFAAPGSGTTFATAVVHDELGFALAPVLTQDELEVFFMNGNDNDIYHSTRATKTEPFGAFEKLTTVSSTMYDQPSDVSPDGCDLYFLSDRTGGSGGYDIWVASRPRPPGL